jgi:hypothetical protein
MHSQKIIRVIIETTTPTDIEFKSHCYLCRRSALLSSRRSPNPRAVYYRPKNEEPTALQDQD